MTDPIVYAFGILCSSFFGVVSVYTMFAVTKAVFCPKSLKGKSYD